MAAHSSILAWRILWTGEPGGLLSMGSHRVGHNWRDLAAAAAACIGEGNGNPLHYSCVENPRDVGAWWAAVCGVARSWTRLKRLSSSSSGRTNIPPGVWPFPISKSFEVLGTYHCCHSHQLSSEKMKAKRQIPCVCRLAFVSQGYVYYSVLKVK